MTEKQIEFGLQALAEEFGEERVQKAIDAVGQFGVEVPSWVFGAFGGGRFGGYMPPGFARNIEEKLDDAAFVNTLTGAVSGVATHILWDHSEDGLEGSLEIARQVARQAECRGLTLGSMSPTYFLKGSHRGSLSSEEQATRARYIAQTLLAVKIARELANGLVTVWLPDGSNYPGQVELRSAYRHVKESLREIAAEVAALNRDARYKRVRLLIEYKVFEPGTYSTVVSDWGSADRLAREFGADAGVLVDMGHHHHSTNVEQIVARLLSEGIGGGFHFNTRYAADDDHAVEPNPEMARIFYELLAGGGALGEKRWAFMIDQCSGRENRIAAVLHSIDSLQLSLAKGILVDQERLARFQEQDDIIAANRVFNDALMNADVRPVVAKARLQKGLAADPVQAFRESRYQESIERTRSQEVSHSGEKP